ncbi:UNVERIFIED_ORG: hypothetical protein ABIB21_003102 [Arthrobacter sp. UYEF13]
MSEQPPAAVTEDLDRLRANLDAATPAKTEANLLIGTWNIRALGDLTAKWLAEPKDSPKRDWHAIACLAAVISRFDVVAVQESRRNPKALKRLLASLGSQWQVIISDVTEGSPGNGERLTFLYDSTRVQPSGLVGEIVLPPVGEDPQRQFARTPYTASFTRAGTEFTLASVHVLWGKKPAERLPEITAFAEWMRNWADRPNDWNTNLMVLGTSIWTGSEIRCTRRSSPPGCGRPRNWTRCRGPSSTTTKHSTSTTRSPGSPRPTAPPCCRA